jgi:hypothetical protein
VWDTWNVVQKTVVKPTLAKPGRVSVSMACYSHDGHLIVAGLNNGTLQSWDVRGEAGLLHTALWLFQLKFPWTIATALSLKRVL